MEVSTLLQCGTKWNKEWITKGPGKKSWLAETWKSVHGKSDLFSDTCCFITAEALAWKLTKRNTKWELVEAKNFEEMEAKYSYFQVMLGTGVDDVDHVVSVYKGHVVQSFFKLYPIKSMAITDELRRAFNFVEMADSYTKISNVILGKPIAHLKVFYFAPSSSSTPKKRKL